MSYGDGKALVTGASGGIGAAVAEVWLGDVFAVQGCAIPIMHSIPTPQASRD